MSSQLILGLKGKSGRPKAGCGMPERLALDLRVDKIQLDTKVHKEDTKDHKGF